MSVDNTGGYWQGHRERGWTSDFMCERADAMTPERLAEIEREMLDPQAEIGAHVWELVEEIKQLWIDKDSMIPMEQC